jgi:transaldolase
MPDGPLQELREAGQSVWIDFLARDWVRDGDLAKQAEAGVLGITSNPTIFESAMSEGDAYDEQIRRELDAGVDDLEDLFWRLAVTDVQEACDVLLPVFEATDHVDGRVSLEVDPRLAHDTERTLEEARRLVKEVDRPNLLTKIPATEEGIEAIRRATAEGISVNVTLIFSLERYAAVIDAYLDGVRRAKENGHDIATIHSVASFFVSRVDTEVDKRLDAIGTSAAASLKGKAGIANARLAYELFEKRFAEPAALELIAAGANVQRPLWASTGVKDPALPDTLYVTELVAPGTVNTMPEKTLEATFDHAEITGDTVTGSYEDAHRVFDELADAGVDLTDVTQVLEDEGVEKFIVSWHDLQSTVRTALDSAR